VNGSTARYLSESAGLTRWWTHLPEITAPTLLIGGGLTSHIPQDLLVEVSTLVPDCTLVTIPVGHNIHESAPEQFLGAITNWLNPA
jgi:pimeloyl-ACP methyl ester carboxylesterase